MKEKEPVVDLARYAGTYGGYREDVQAEVKALGLAYWVRRVNGRVRVCRLLTLGGVAMAWPQADALGPLRRKEIADLGALLVEHGLARVEHAVDEAIRMHRHGAKGQPLVGTPGT